MKSINKLRPLIILLVILLITGLLNMEALADTPDIIAQTMEKGGSQAPTQEVMAYSWEQLEEGRRETPLQGVATAVTEGKSPMAGVSTYSVVDVNLASPANNPANGIDVSIDTITLSGLNKSYRLYGTTTTYRVVVVGGVAGNTVNITLDGATITPSVAGTAALFINSGKVLLNLEENTINSLTGKGNGGGIEVGAGKEITISGTGSLTARSSASGAGIGGGVGGAGGNITITGGTVTATSSSGAGIGGGNGGDGGNITINGGNINATSSTGAGIGGGSGGAGGNITINGGTVEATSVDGAGIGGGANGDGGDVTISGEAEVTAESTLAKDVGGGSNGGRLVVEGDAVLTLATGNSGSGAAPTIEINENGIIINGRDGTIMEGGISLVLDISADKSTVVLSEKVTITVDISKIRDTLALPLGKVELLKDGLMVKEIAGITATANNMFTYEFIPTEVGDFNFTVRYTKVGNEPYKNTLSAVSTVKVSINPPTTYSVAEIPSAKNNYTAKVDVDFKDFIGVTVDQKTLISTDFTAWSGSTFVRLEKAYLSTLSDGNHIITLSFNGGTATATFTKSATGIGSTGGGSGTGSGKGTGSGTGGTIIGSYGSAVGNFPEIISSGATKPSDEAKATGSTNPATGARDIISVETMFAIFSLVGSVIMRRKKKIN